MLTKAGIDYGQRLEIQRGRIRRMEYTTIGMLAVIVFDADQGAMTPEEERITLGRRIDLMGQKVPIALSPDHEDLLLPAGLPRQLPQIPDPRWPGASVVGEKTPYLPQRWQDRASGVTDLLGRKWLVCRPVATILMANVGYFKGAHWPKLEVVADFTGEHMSLLVDPTDGEAHFVGGRLLPNTRVTINREAQQAGFRV